VAPEYLSCIKEVHAKRAEVQAASRYVYSATSIIPVH
jgi:hypothetical protein